MSARSIHQYPDPILKRPTRPIERIDAGVARLIETLITAMRHSPRCVGLAAPQLGSPLRVAVMDASGHPKAATSQGLIVLVNPRLLAAEGVACQREGCLSIPDFTANVRRATRVRISASDQSGSRRDFWLEGFEAIVAQHEIDHLDGRLFLDRVTNLKTDVFARKTYL